MEEVTLNETLNGSSFQPNQNMVQPPQKIKVILTTQFPAPDCLEFVGQL